MACTRVTQGLLAMATTTWHNWTRSGPRLLACLAFSIQTPHERHHACTGNPLRGG